MLNDDFREITTHAKQAKALAEEWQAINWWEFGSKSVYVARHKSKFEEMAEGLAECRKSIQHVITVIAHSDSFDEILKKQNQLLKELEAMRSTRTKSAEKCQRVQKWADQNSRSITDAAIHPDEKVKEQLIEQLVVVGMPKDEAAMRVVELLKAIRKERNRSKSFQFQAQVGLKEPASRTKSGDKPGDENKKKQNEKGTGADKNRKENENQPKKDQKKKDDKKEEAKTPEGAKQKKVGNEKAEKANPEPNADVKKESQEKKGQEKQNGKAESAKKPKGPEDTAKAPASEAGSLKPSAGKKKAVHFSEGNHPKTENHWILFVDKTNGGWYSRLWTYHGGKLIISQRGPSWRTFTWNSFVRGP
jgi:hypothetical protein